MQIGAGTNCPILGKGQGGGWLWCGSRIGSTIVITCAYSPTHIRPNLWPSLCTPSQVVGLEVLQGVVSKKHSPPPGPFTCILVEQVPDHLLCICVQCGGGGVCVAFYGDGQKVRICAGLFVCSCRTATDLLACLSLAATKRLVL